MNRTNYLTSTGGVSGTLAAYEGPIRSLVVIGVSSLPRTIVILTCESLLAQKVQVGVHRVNSTSYAIVQGATL